MDEKVGGRRWSKVVEQRAGDLYDLALKLPNSAASVVNKGMTTGIKKAAGLIIKTNTGRESLKAFRDVFGSDKERTAPSAPDPGPTFTEAAQRFEQNSMTFAWR